jgi:hypothetical protein
MTNTFVIPYNNGNGGATEIQKWMKENSVKHGPTIRVSDGWKFEIFDDEDYLSAMAFKLTWT